MSKYPDEPLEFGEPEDQGDDYAEYPGYASLPPVDPATPLPGPSQSRQRRMPPDDLPPVRNRPVLPREERQRDQPPSRSRPSVTSPVTSSDYPDYVEAEPPVAGRGRSGNKPPPRSRSPQSPRPQRNKRESGWYLPWWSLLIMLAFVGAAAVGAWTIVDRLGGGVLPGGQTPIVIVITSTYTIGPPASPTLLALPPSLTAPPALPSIVPSGTRPPGTFTPGGTVKVVGVGEQGLNVRTGPGLDSTIKFQAAEGSTFQLGQTPQQASNDEWWFIQDSKDQTRQGWASSRFLEVVTP